MSNSDNVNLDLDLDLDTRASSDSTSVTLCLMAARSLLLTDLLETGVIPAEEWRAVQEHGQPGFDEIVDDQELLARLAEARLLTAYQISHIRKQGGRSLVLGNYRLLEQIGSGGMGIVYRGEHMLLRRPVAVKVLHLPQDAGDTMLQRFFVEMRALARIRHPNIVWALDAGAVKISSYDRHATHYFVMEHIPGQNLEQTAAAGALSISRACDLIYQIATALEETHKLGLIHRDIKPSNILVTPQDKAKLLDFGLALNGGRRRLTTPGTLLGTLNYMAPEQVSDAANVDIRADIFGLGATLFFCLTGCPPFATQGNVAQQVAARMAKQPPELRSHCPNMPAELETVVRRMMAYERDDRYARPESLLRALLPFVNRPTRASSARIERLGENQSEAAEAVSSSVGAAWDRAGLSRLLIVDDEPNVRKVCMRFFRREDFQCTDANGGEEALKLLSEREFDLVLLDIDMPRMSGAETLRRLRQNLPGSHVKVIMMSGRVSGDEMAALLALGADDYLGKPLDRAQLVSRVEAWLAHKTTQDRSDGLKHKLLAVNGELERALSERNADLTRVRETLLYALARIVESRSQESSGHLTRMPQYAAALARHLARPGEWAAVIDEVFVRNLEACTPLHDIGNVALPDHILRRTAALGTEDRIIMQAHTTIGADTLASVAKHDRTAAAFWQMAIDVSRHHHERHDGAGYPGRLAGQHIPLAARIVALVDAYDTLRAPSGLAAPLSHNAAAEIIAQGAGGRFDPLLAQAFGEVESTCAEIFNACPDAAGES